MFLIFNKLFTEKLILFLPHRITDERVRLDLGESNHFEDRLQTARNLAVVTRLFLPGEVLNEGRLSDRTSGRWVVEVVTRLFLPGGECNEEKVISLGLKW